MSNHWWRAYDDAVDNAKLLLLSDAQHRGWFNLLCLASANGGTLPEMKVMSVKLRMKPARVQALIDGLTEAKLIDQTETGTRPHDWNDRQYKSDVSTTRVKRFRERKRNVSETDQRQSTETDKSSVPRGTGAEALPDPKADYFRRGRQVCGPQSGGLLSKLLKSQGNEDDPKAIAKARARIEDASTKAKPAEWIGRVMNGAARAVTADGERFPEGII